MAFYLGQRALSGNCAGASAGPSPPVLRHARLQARGPADIDVALLFRLAGTQLYFAVVWLALQREVPFPPELGKVSGVLLRSLL